MNSTERENLSALAEAIDLAQFLASDNPLLQTLIDALPFPIFYKDIEGRYLGCNRSFENFIRISRQELVGKSVHDLYDPIRADIYDRADRELFENPGIQRYESEIRSGTGEVLFVKFHKTSFVDSEGAIAGLIGAIFDITEQKNLERTLQQLASHDELTGLYNRREVMQRARELQQSSDRSGESFSLLILDLDHFKTINDQYGHSSGDRALQLISQQLESLCRGADIVARYGGEEFMVLLPATDNEQARTIAERYRHRIAEHPLDIDGQRISVSVSIGIASYRRQSLDELIQQADTALYRAKSRGRNCVQLY